MHCKKEATTMRKEKYLNKKENEDALIMHQSIMHNLVVMNYVSVQC